MDKKDVLIIGSGPAGMTAAIYGMRAGLSLAVVEKTYMGSGQIALSSRVDNYPGLYGMDGFSLGNQIRKHGESLGTEYITGEVTGIEKTEDGSFCLRLLGKEEKLQAKAIIFATGAAYRKLSVSGEEKLTGRGVSYCATCDGALYKGKTVAVVGGGDTALDDALYLAQFCEKVYLIHRRDEFRAAPISVQRVKENPSIEVITPAKVLEIEGSDRVEGIVLDNGTKLLVQGVFIAIGMLPVTDLLKGLLPLTGEGYVQADVMGRTSLEGLFVAGDCKEKELRQVITAAADGACAATAAREYLQQ